MKCNAAQRLLSAERDGALETSERAALQEHLVTCEACRNFQSALATAMDTWRKSNIATAVPDVEHAWNEIRREIRTAAPQRSRATATIFKWTLPVAAAGALAAAFVFSPRASTSSNPEAIARLEKPHADFVEVPSDATSLVYVDDQSGWLVVWAVNDDPHHTGG